MMKRRPSDERLKKRIAGAPSARKLKKKSKLSIRGSVWKAKDRIRDTRDMRREDRFMAYDD